MSQFEYIIGFVSILMGLAVAELLAGLGRIARERSTTRIYWVQIVWMILMIIFFTQSWWLIWSMQESAIESYPRFMLFLLPRFLFIIAAFVISPPIVRGEPLDLKDFYFEQCHLAAPLVATALTAALVSILRFGVQELMSLETAVAAVGILLLFALGLSKEPRIHEAVTAAMCVVLGAFTVLSSAG